MQPFFFCLLAFVFFLEYNSIVKKRKEVKWKIKKQQF